MPSKTYNMGPLVIDYSGANSSSVDITADQDATEVINGNVSTGSPLNFDFTEAGVTTKGQFFFTPCSQEDRLVLRMTWTGAKRGSYNGVIGTLPKP